MNKYSLKFQNQLLEDRYIMYSNKQQIIQIRTFLKISLPMLFFQGVACFCDESYIDVGIASALMIIITGLHKATIQLSELNAIRCYEISMLMNPLWALMAFYYSTSLIFTINLMVLILVSTQMLILTPNVFLAVVHLVNNFITNLIIMYQMFGLTLYMITWLPIFVFYVYHYYIQKRNERLLFQQSQVNESIYNLIQETVNDDVIYFKFNSELLEYELEFSSICDLDLNAFLSSVKTDQKQNLKSYLFSKIGQNRIKFSKERVIVYQRQQRLELGVFIQYYPQLRFYIRIIKEQKTPNTFSETESQQMYSFYREMILTCKHKSHMLNFRNIMTKLCSFNARVNFERIMKSPYNSQLQVRPFNIISILRQYLGNLQLKYQIKCDMTLVETIVQSDIIFQTMIYYILRQIKGKNSGVNIIIQTYPLEIELTFHFPKVILYSKLYEHRLRFLQELLSCKQIIIQNLQIRCFIEQNKEIAFI